MEFNLAGRSEGFTHTEHILPRERDEILRMSVDELNGTQFIQFRIWVDKKDINCYIPTMKGITIRKREILHATIFLIRCAFMFSVISLKELVEFLFKIGEGEKLPPPTEFKHQYYEPVEPVMPEPPTPPPTEPTPPPTEPNHDFQSNNNDTKSNKKSKRKRKLEKKSNVVLMHKVC